VVLPTIFPTGTAVIDLMAVLPEVKVKLPKVNVTVPKESVASGLVFPPNVMPPTPFKVKLAGYLKNILLGNVFDVVFVKVTVPELEVK
jgi:hypothetical protein